MRKRLIDYFSFSKREYNGLLVLIVLIMVAKLSPSVYNYCYPAVFDVHKEDKALQQLILLNREEIGAHGKREFDSFHNASVKVKPFRFDPNVLDAEGWQLLGLSQKQTQVVMKYRAKGGRFYKPEDVKKMYTISPALYEQLRPFISIQAQEYAGAVAKQIYIPREFSKSLKRDTMARTLIEINGADVAALDQIKGVGPYFARRIIEYREKLGGFCRKEQLKEVYGLDSAKYLEIAAQVSIDISLIEKVNINTITEKDYRKLSYFTYKQVKAIVEFRKQHGNYSNFADLKKVVILTQEAVDKMAPYISFIDD